MNLKSLFLAVFVFIATLGCNKSSEIKETEDPTEKLEWLKAKKTELAASNCNCVPTIWQAVYQGQTVYEIGCKQDEEGGSLCFCAHVFYDENGNIVPGPEGEEQVAFLSKIKDKKILWSCNK